MENYTYSRTNTLFANTFQTLKYDNQPNQTMQQFYASLSINIYIYIG
jgi:hypothetical protein